MSDEAIEVDSKALRFTGEWTAELGNALGLLSDFTRRMHFYAWSTLTAVILDLLGFGLVLCFGRLRSEYHSFPFSVSEFVASTVFTVVCVCVLGIISLVAFESARQRGGIYFEEISNELQWGIATKIEFKSPQEKPRLEYRLVLREFVQASDLPLVPGKFGPAIYAALLLLLALLSMFGWSSVK